MVMDSIIHDSQTAFMTGRSIHDNILMTHELIRGYNRKHISPRCTIQIDLQKAYDTVCWDALETIMAELSFPNQFIEWIMLAVRSVSYRYLVNGQVSDILKAKRGLRQGDPVSPLLFVLVMEYLHRCMMELKENKDFKYHPRCAKLNITNICFADDLMLFARGDVLSVKTMMCTFNKFSEETGLKANPDKCKVFFGGTDYDIQHAIRVATGCVEGTLPIRYLGVPLTSRKLSVIQCQPLIDKMVERIQHWSVKFLSYAGRQQLVQSVLMSISSYWMSVFPLPKKIIQKIEALCRNFLWSAKTDGRKALVAWEHLCEPRNAGGLNFKKLLFWNRATIMKLLWNIHNKNDKLWIRWLDIYFMKGNPILTWPVKHTSSWMMNCVLKCRIYTHNNEAWESANTMKRFDTATVYRSICGESNKVPWKHLFYQNHARPRAKFILWLALWGRLGTKDRLEKIGINHDKHCCFCLQHETINHLFFDCAFTGFVWRNLLSWNGYLRQVADWDKEKKWLFAELGKKGWRREFLRVTLTETVYHIWKDRNEILFKDRSPNLDVIRRIIDSVISRCLLARNLQNHINASRDSIS
ncbi:uncharacterized protein LOC131642722 [Vicia villosa]|uniref:uncharacterized protein LOC131642722 n=1 Tax=Vicia villosa TaxID=3911 RepID=UPI00273CBF33|nr:uncharacterized protein LOC131642722 [Vicia villosa]